ncbi:MAG TPA: asparagine synthase (glutamine-hydrolyzing) [Firmicutes bacterium]|nr:asparagine synthase (glutamine-hydrolyzing) [Bacillota bacterium]
MCAICGIIKKEGEYVEEKLLKEMTRIMDYRGPDEEGYFLKENVGFGHRRLSIIDLKRGRQPLYNEEKNIVLICNGEIYNFMELRKILEKKGHNFRTNSDNEVIIHLYEEKKERCLEDLRGMFAFAIWDDREKVLFLARDRIGQKPLLYSEINNGIIFASEIKALLLYPEISTEIDFEALMEYLTYQGIPSPRTIFSKIKKLPPAHFLIWKGGKIKIERYWDIDFTKKIRLKNEMEYAELLWERLKESTRLRMVSDVPLGAFLSGGIDSSTIVGLMSEISDRPVKTFSIGFEIESYSELKYAKLVAEKFNTEHYEFVVKPEVIKILPKLIWHYNEPFADSSMIPTYYVARETSKYVKVALNGDGGDENLGGYIRYYQTKLLERVYKIFKRTGILSGAFNSVVEKFYKRYPYNTLSRIFEWIREADRYGFYYAYARRLISFSPEWHAKLYSFKIENPEKTMEIVKDIWEKAGEVDMLEKMLYTDFHLYLPEILMVKMDIATMANSLEGRSPFLDHKLIETIASFPPEIKLKGKISKYILKKKLKGFLPDEILKRGKMGFGVPIGEWFRKELKDYIKDILFCERFEKRGFFNTEVVKNMVEEHISGRVKHTHRIWALLCFELWCRIFLDKEKLF